MNVKDYLLKRMDEGTIHMTLIDPDKQTPEEAARIAAVACELGTDAIMVGGSTDINQKNLDETSIAIKDAVDLPVIYFPSGANAISPHCDAIYFMSMLNSRNVNMVIREQMRGGPIVRKLGLEAISMGYIIVSPGMKVGEVGEADVVGQEDVSTAVGYALAAQLLGMSLVYLEAGSGAETPVPPGMISAVRSSLDVPLIVGGGIRTPEQALAAKEAGANAVVTGTLVEKDDFEGGLRNVLRALKG